MIDHYFHAPQAFHLHQDAVQHFCHPSNFPRGHRLCSSRHSVRLCISRQHSHRCSNKKSQGATHRQQLPIKHAEVSDRSFKGQFPRFPFGKQPTAAKSRVSPDQLHSFLGSLHHYGCFCPNFSSIARPLYLLLKRDVHWKWLPLHLKAVHDLLVAISKGSLTCYDISKPLFIMSDASKDGLGFVLSHDTDQREIIWMGSHVLSLAEANYSNIECEALTIVEAVKYFHQFLAGRHFIIRSDHAPLKFIFNLKNNAGRVSC